jgi:hypothetical protein
MAGRRSRALRPKPAAARSIRSDDVPAELYDALRADALTLGIPDDESEIVVWALRFLHERAEGRRATAALHDWEAARGR